MVPFGFFIRSSMQRFKRRTCHRCWEACCIRCMVTWHPLACRSSHRPWEHVTKCSVRSRCQWPIWTWRPNHRNWMLSIHRYVRHVYWSVDVSFNVLKIKQIILRTARNDTVMLAVKTLFLHYSLRCIGCYFYLGNVAVKVWLSMYNCRSW